MVCAQKRAGEKQYKRWHMAKPVDPNPYRNGCPSFMDANMIALEVDFLDRSKLLESFHQLAEWRRDGISTSGCNMPAVGNIVALMLA